MRRLGTQLANLFFLSILMLFIAAAGSAWCHEGASVHEGTEGHSSASTSAEENGTLLTILNLIRHRHPIAHRSAKRQRSVLHVLILGDSISMGYTPHVRSLLAGHAEVVRPEENCGPTSHGLERIEAWLGDDDWDVIHFNFGLHDMKYVDDQGERVSTDTGKVQVPLPQYEQNLPSLWRGCVRRVPN